MADSDMNITLEKVTPERARDLLALNRHNRPLRQRYVQALATDMTAGNWRLNGEAIKIAKDGLLLDGQHRLAAVIESGATVEMMVVVGLDISDQETMDTGRKRSLADVLALRGEENVASLAAAVGIYWRRQAGQITSNASPTNQQALAVLADHPGLRHSVTYASRVARTLRYSQGLAAALHYEMSLLNAEDAGDFWSKLESGLGLHERHPIYILRRRLEDNAAVIGRKLDRLMVHAFTIKAWNAYREGRDMTLVRWTRGGANPEAFPEVQ